VGKIKSLDWTTGLDYRTGLLDWITGLDYWTGLQDWTTRLLKKTPCSVQDRS